MKELKKPIQSRTLGLPLVRIESLFQNYNP
jgi:hypothetical protein